MSLAMVRRLGHERRTSIFPADPMSVRRPLQSFVRNRWGLLAAALGVMLGTALVAGLWAWSQRDAWASQMASERLGLEVVVSGLEPAIWRGETRIAQVTVAHPRATVVCDGVRAPSVAALRAGLPVQALHLGSCNVTEIPQRPAAEQPAAAEATADSPWTPWIARAQSVALAWDADVVRLVPDGRPEVRVEALRMRSDETGLQADAEISSPAFEHRAVAVHVAVPVQGPIEVRTPTPLEWRGYTVAFDVARIAATRTLEVEGVRIADDTAQRSVDAARITVAEVDGSWEIRASDGVAQWHGGADEGSTAPVEPVAPAPTPDADARTPAEDADCASPPCDVRPAWGHLALEALVEAASGLPALRARLLAAERPPVTVGLERMRLEWGTGPGIDIATLNLHRDGTLQGSVELSGVQVGFSASLATLDVLEFEAENVDLAAVGPRLGESVSTRGRFGLQGRMELDDETGLSWSGSARVEAAGFTWPAIAPGPVDDIHATIDGRVRLTWGEAARIESSFDIDWGATPLRVEADVRRVQGVWNGEGALLLRRETPCQDIWESIPQGMLPNLGHASVSFTGSTEGRLAATYTFGDPWSFDLLSELFPGSCRISRVARAWDPAQLNRPSWTFLVTEGVTRNDIVVGPGTPTWVPIESLPGYVPAAMYLSEEMGFYSGVGISLNLIRRAVSLNIERGRYVYGGSTIMQQLVKNLFLSRAKTLSRKLEEAVLVWAMLDRVEKDHILALYLNCIEFGPDIYGIDAAARYYFNKPPQWLTPLEAIFLANLKPAPRDGANYMRRGHSPDHGWWIERTRTMLERLRDVGLVHPDEVDFYAPYVVALTASPAAATSGYAPVERPAWALPGALPGSGKPESETAPGVNPAAAPPLAP